MGTFDKQGNPIGDGRHHVKEHVYEFNEYPQISAKVTKSLTTETTYVKYYNSENGKSITVRFSNHVSNAVLFGDQLNGYTAKRDEILFYLGLKKRTLIPNTRLHIWTQSVAKKKLNDYEYTDKTIGDLYELGEGADISKHKGKIAKGSNYLILGDSVEKVIDKKINSLGQKVVLGEYVYSDISVSDEKFKRGGEITPDVCVNYIKKTESILRNGYYSDHGLFYLITYNSGGGEGLNVYQTVNYALVDKLAFFLGFNDTTVDVMILKHYEDARRFDNLKILKEIKGKPVIIIDRDTIVCSNYDRKKVKLKDGGEVSDEMENFDWNSLYEGVNDNDTEKESSKQPKYDIEKIKSLIDQKIDDEKAIIEDWSSRDYKSNKGIVYTGGDDIHGTPLQIGSINESRRRNKINSAERVISELSLAKDIVEKYRGNESDLYNIVLDDYRKNYYRGYKPSSHKRDYKAEQRYSDAYDLLINTVKESEAFKSGGEVNKETSDAINKYYQDLIKRNLPVDLADYKLKKYLKDNNATTNDGLVKSYITSETEYQKLNSEYKSEFKKMQDANRAASDKFKKLSHIDRQKGLKMYEEYFEKYLAEEIKEDQLSKGTKVELEHKETLDKVASGEITPEQGVEETAKTHIEEDPMYYDKLEEMENTLEMNSEAPTKKEETKEEKDMSNIGVDDWSKIPDSNKYITKVVSKAFAYDPYDKVFQIITGNFTANDSLRPVMAGVFFGKSGICVTNAHILLYMNHVSNKFEEGTYCVSPDCLKVVPEDQIKNNMVDAKFPNYEAVVPISQPYVYEIDLLSVKTYCETLIRSKYVNQTTKVVLFTYDNNRIIGFNGRFMIDACDSLLKMGYNRAKIGLSEPSRAGLIVPDMSYDGSESPMGKSDFALIMPVKVKNMTESDVFDHTTFQGDTDFEIGGNLAYSFEKDAVITAGGNITHKIDTTLTKEKAKQVNSVKPELISIISSVLKRSRAIPILDYVLVKDGGIESTDLETHFRVTGVNLPDGMYALNGDSLFPDKHEAEDYPIFPPRKFDFNKIGDINRQEFLFHFKKCLDFVGSDELRPVMSGIHLSKEGDKLVIEATDANALYRAEIEKFNIDGDFSVIIPNPKLVHKLLNVFDCDDIEFSLNKESNGLSMTCGEGSIYSRLIDGEYPNTSRVYPTRYDKVIKLKTADLKRILNEIKVEKKKAGIKPSEMFSVAFNPTDGKYEIAYVEYSGGYNRERKFTKYKTGDISIPITHGENDLYSKTYPLIMPIMLGEGYSEGNVIGISDYNIDRIISLGYSEFEMALSEPTKAIVIINKPIIFGTKETSMQKEKKAKKDTIVDPIEPVVEKTFSGKIPAEKITIHWAEGDNSKYDKFPKDYKTYEEANKAVIPVFYDNYKDGDGGYNKVKFTITFVDGETYEGRLDVSEKEDNPTVTTNVIGKHIKDVLDYELSDKSKSSEEDKSRIKEWINKYDIGFDVVLKEKTDESQQIKDSIEGLEIIKKLTRNKRERQEYQDAIDGLRLLLNAEETFSVGGEVEAEKETFAI